MGIEPFVRRMQRHSYGVECHEGVDCARPQTVEANVDRRANVHRADQDLPGCENDRGDPVLLGKRVARKT